MTFEKKLLFLLNKKFTMKKHFCNIYHYTGKERCIIVVCDKLRKIIVIKSDNETFYVPKNINEGKLSLIDNEYKLFINDHYGYEVVYENINNNKNNYLNYISEFIDKFIQIESSIAVAMDIGYLVIKDQELKEIIAYLLIKHSEAWEQKTKITKVIQKTELPYLYRKLRQLYLFIKINL